MLKACSGGPEKKSVSALCSRPKSQLFDNACIAVWVVWLTFSRYTRRSLTASRSESARMGSYKLSLDLPVCVRIQFTDSNQRQTMYTHLHSSTLPTAARARPWRPQAVVTSSSRSTGCPSTRISRSVIAEAANGLEFAWEPAWRGSDRAGCREALALRCCSVWLVQSRCYGSQRNVTPRHRPCVECWALGTNVDEQVKCEFTATSQTRGIGNIDESSRPSSDGLFVHTARQGTA